MLKKDLEQSSEGDSAMTHQLSLFLDSLKLAVAGAVMVLAVIAHSPYAERLAGMYMEPAAPVAALDANIQPMILRAWHL